MRTQFTTRLPEPLATALAERAQANHRSANAELTAILAGALSGTPSTLAGVHTGRAIIDMDFAAIEARTVAHFAPDLTPYKAALQRLIDDSAALREKYEDLDEAVEQAQKLLHT